jgi:hypothetical protein
LAVSISVYMRAARAAIGTGEGPVVATDRDRARRSLGSIITEIKTAIIHKARHRGPACGGIADRRRQAAFGAHLCKHLLVGAAAMLVKYRRTPHSVIPVDIEHVGFMSYAGDRSHSIRIGSQIGNQSLQKDRIRSRGDIDGADARTPSQVVQPFKGPRRLNLVPIDATRLCRRLRRRERSKRHDILADQNVKLPFRAQSFAICEGMFKMSNLETYQEKAREWARARTRRTIRPNVSSHLADR